MDSQVTGVVLAGGRARRMGGEDKGLIHVGGRPMVSWVTGALAPQCAQVLISANRNQERYANLTGLTVIADTLADHAGPLAGMLSALRHCATERLVSVPCDSPLLRPDLVARLRRALEENAAELAVAHDGHRMQPVFTLIPRQRIESLERFLAGGGRKIDRWFEAHRTACADFSDAPDMFANINTPEQRDALEATLMEHIS